MNKQFTRDMLDFLETVIDYQGETDPLSCRARELRDAWIGDPTIARVVS